MIKTPTKIGANLPCTHTRARMINSACVQKTLDRFCQHPKSWWEVAPSASMPDPQAPICAGTTRKSCPSIYIMGRSTQNRTNKIRGMSLFFLDARGSGFPGRAGLAETDGSRHNCRAHQGAAQRLGIGQHPVMATNLHAECSDGGTTPAKQLAVLSECILRHFDRILFIVSARMNARLSQLVTAEDLTHEVVVEALHRGESFKYQGEASFVRWISTVAYRVVYDAARGQDRAPSTLSIRNDGATEGDVRPSRIPGQTRTPSSIAASNERCRRVQTVLASMRERDRAVIRMVQLESRSLSEVAAHMRCSKEAAAKCLARALGRLRAEVTDCGHELNR